ncbi:hypothetical protein, partial [Corallococcus sp. AB030]|uniref:hypothetical protein n=1 Tax=Corallococcus sp. AB030 TaxID=2316716 RepID=UPI001F21ADF5
MMQMSFRMGLHYAQRSKSDAVRSCMHVQCSINELLRYASGSEMTANSPECSKHEHCLTGLAEHTVD